MSLDTPYRASPAYLRAAAAKLGPGWRVDRKFGWLVNRHILLIPQASGSWMCTAGTNGAVHDVIVQAVRSTPVLAMRAALRHIRVVCARADETEERLLAALVRFRMTKARIKTSRPKEPSP